MSDPLVGIEAMSAAPPKPEQVSAYLEQHQLEAVIENAVNDAVVQMVEVSSCFDSDKLLIIIRSHENDACTLFTESI